MLLSREAVLTLAALILPCGQTWAQVQARFGNPVAVGKAEVPEETQVPGPQNPKQTLPDDLGLTAPTRDQLFRVQSERSLQERLRKELPKVKKVDFPKDATPLREVPDADLVPFPEQVISPIASQVCYRPLYFEDKRTERFGHYVPLVQPFMSAGRFYGDALILPYRLWQTPPWTFECDNR